MPCPLRATVTVFWITSALCWAQSPALKDVAAEGKASIAKNDLAGAEKIFRGGLERATTESDTAWQAEFNRAIGETYQRRFQWKQALGFYEASLALRQARGDKVETAYMTVGIGQVYANLRDDAAAEKWYAQGLEAYRALGDKVQVAQVLQLAAQSKIQQAKLAEAEAFLLESTSLFDVLKDVNSGASSRAALAEIARRRSEYGTALQFSFEALDMQRAKPSPPLLARILESLANTFLDTEQPEKALAYYRQCLEQRIKINNPQGIAQSYNNIGFTLQKLGDYAGAVDALGKALEIRKTRGSPAELAETMNNLGFAQLSARKTAAAAATLEAALKSAESRKDDRQTSLALYGLGNIAMGEGKLDEAIEMHTRSLGIREKSGDRMGAVHSLNRIALAREMKGDLEGSEKAHRAALEEFEKIAAGITNPAQVGRFRQSTFILYPYYARVLLKQGRTDAAFEIAERSRGAGLARMNAMSRRGFQESLSGADRTAWMAASADRARASNRLREVLAAEVSDPAKIERSHAVYEQADNALDQLRDHLYASDTKLAPASEARAKASLILKDLEPGTLYLEWLCLDDSTLLFAVSGGKIRAFNLPVSRDQLRALVNQWRGSLGEGVSRGQRAEAKAKADADAEQSAARKLHTAVLGPLAAELMKSQHKRIVAVPDGPLLEAPLAAMLSDEGKRLIEMYPLTTAVSVESAIRRSSRPRAPKSMLAVSDPMDAGEQRVVAPSGGRYSALEFARAEASSAASGFPGSMVLSGEERHRIRDQEGSRFLPSA